MVKVRGHFKTWFCFKTGPCSKTELKQLGELAVKYDKKLVYHIKDNEQILDGYLHKIQ